MPIVRAYPVGEISPRPLPDVAPIVPAAGDLALFGGNRARDLQLAGQQIGQASNALFALYERQAQAANDTRVQDLNDRFINGKRDELVGRIQERYGIARDDADRQVRDWERDRAP